MINTKWANILTEDMLIKKYLTENKSACVIAKEFGCCQSQVYFRLHKFGIKVKTLSEAKVFGTYHTKNYCCMECGNLINRHTACYGLGRCVDCNKKFRFGKNASTYIDGRSSNARCTECNKKVSYGYKHCGTCSQLGKLNPMYGKVTKSKRLRYKSICFRSSWEANFAKWCDGSGIKWEFEIKAFEVRVKNKDRSYTPDFYLPEFNLWIEIKGWWRDDAKEKYDCFLKQYPKINIEVWDKKTLKERGLL